MGQQGSYPIGARVINLQLDTATGVVSGATCDIPLNALAAAIQVYMGITTPFQISAGGTGATSAAGALANLGVRSMGQQDAGSVAITGGTIAGVAISSSTATLSTALAVSSGGTGTNLLTAGGVLVGNGTAAVTVANAGPAGTVLTSNGTGQPPTFQNAGASAVSSIIAGTGINISPLGGTGNVTVNLTTPVAIANGGTGSTTVAGAQTSLGLGTMAVQNASNVNISGGTISLGTPLAIGSGGTGATTATAALLNLGAAPSTYTRSATNAQSLTWGQRVEVSELNLKDFYTGSNTDQDALTKLFAACAAQQRTARIPVGLGAGVTLGAGSYLITAEIQWDHSKHSVICDEGVIFDISGIPTPGSWVGPSGGTFTVAPNAAIGVYGNYNAVATAGYRNKWKGGQFQAAASAPNAGVTAMRLGPVITDTTNGGAWASFEKVLFYICDMALVATNNTYLNVFDECTFTEIKQNAFNMPNTIAGTGRTNSGENFMFNNCVFANSGGRSTYALFDVHAADVWVSGGSLDYSGGPWVQFGNQSRISMRNMHIEWSGDTGAVCFKFLNDGSQSNLCHVDSSNFTHTSGAQTNYIFSMNGSGGGSACQMLCTNSDFYLGGTYGNASFCDSSAATCDFDPALPYNESGMGRIVDTACSIAGTTTAGTATYTANNNIFTVAKGIMTFTFNVAWSATTGTGNLLASFYAFPKNTVGFDVPVNVGYYSGISVASGSHLIAKVVNGTTNISFYTVSATGTVTALPIPASGSLLVSGTIPCYS
jgi:hypothetical protein